MSILDDILAMDAAFVVNADLMPGTETITYRPLGGSDRQITAQVFRDVPDEAQGNVTLKTSIFVTRADVPLVTVAGDLVVQLPDIKGKKRDRKVASISKSDAGGYELTLE